MADRTAGQTADGSRLPPVDRPWKVFVSHTGELAEHPQSDTFVAAVKRAFERIGHVPVEMATWTSADRPSATECRRKVRECDVYVGVIGFRYGSPVRDDPDRSYTELEFHTAGELGLPRLVFLVAEDLNVVVPRSFYVDDAHGDRQTAFRHTVREGRVAAAVSSPANLETLVAQALRDLRDEAVEAADAVGGSPVGAAVPGPVVNVPALLGSEVTRPELMNRLIEQVTAAVGPGGSTGSTVGMTGVSGAGGFGKTTLARMLVNRPEIRAAFPDGMVWVTIGEDAVGPELASTITDLCHVVSGEKPPLTDPELAGGALGASFGERQMLLVIDDVWTSAQLSPFLRGAPNVVRLVTTRRPSVLPDAAGAVPVAAMTPDDATRLITDGLRDRRHGTAGGSAEGDGGAEGDDPIDPRVVAGLLEATGRWPLLLGLVRGSARDAVRHGATANDALTEVLDLLRADGPAALDVDDEDEDNRTRAVSASLGVSLRRLTDAEQQRFTELAVFGEDVEVPLPVVERYWAHTGGLSPIQARRLCARLDDLALLAEYRRDAPGPRIRLHDVTRAWLRSDLDLPALDWAVIDAHRSLVPEHPLPVGEDADEGRTGSAWWQLDHDGPSDDYLWQWVPAHLWGAGLTDELDATVVHPDWLLGALELGPATLESQLALAAIDHPSDQARALAVAVRQNGHLLAALDPPRSLAATLASRLPSGDVDGVRSALVARATTRGAALVSITDPPDLPHPALRRTLTGHTGRVVAAAAAPDGSWLATTSWDGTARIWDPTTGECIAALRVDGPLTCAASTGPRRVAVAGAHGPYLLDLVGLLDEENAQTTGGSG